MKAAWLQDFFSDLRALKSGQISSIYLHSKQGDSWVIDVGSAATATELEEVTDSSACARNGKRCLFPLCDIRVVVEANFVKAPQKSTREQFSTTISERREYSQHRFDALHDSLTGCKNRKSFEIDMAAVLLRVAAPEKSSLGSLGEAGGNAIALAAMDIDHFKRINDGRGHDYGDLVLKSFAWLLEDECKQARVRYPGSEFTVYRLGGEEFSVLVVGKLDEIEVLAWIESVRQKIEMAIIPSVAHLEVFRRDGAVVMSIPPEAERRLTSSIGVARFSGLSSDESAIIAGDLKVKSDKALYAAKNAGRNRAIYFPDILKKFGRVIENDSSAAVVIIDIGSDVGVELGREFFVIPKRYSGDAEFVVDDGRSRKVLGKIPRLKVAKLVAFDVQAEISFCSITEVRDGIEVAAGSLIESIPLGIFGGLLAPHKGLAGGGDNDERAIVTSAFLANPLGHSAVVSLKLEGIRKVEQDYGQLQANEILASVSAVMASTFQSSSHIAHAELGCFSLAVSLEGSDLDDSVAELVAAVRKSVGHLVKFRVGVFEGEVIESGAVPGLSSTFALDYSLIAAAAAQINEVEKFNIHSAFDVLNRGNEEGLADEVIADYHRFRKMGINGPGVQNCLGIALFKNQSFVEAASAFKAATDLSDDVVFRSNCAIAQYYAGRFVQAYQNFSVAYAGIGGAKLNDNLLGIYAASAAGAFKAGRQISAEEVDHLFDIAFDQAQLRFVSAIDLAVEHGEWERHKLGLDLDEEAGVDDEGLSHL